MRGGILAVSAALLWTAPAGAQEACPYGPALLSAAELLLTEPAEKSRFYRDLYGADAAYLTIRYGGGGKTEADELLTLLEARRPVPERMTELRLAHATTEERQALIAAMEPDPRHGTVLTKLADSALRALVVEDGGGWLITEMKRWAALKREESNAARVALDVSVGRAIADIADADKLAFAKAAEKAKLWNLAFTVQAQRDNLTDLVDLIERAPPKALGAGDGPLTPAMRKDLWKRALTLAELRPSFDIAAQPISIRTVDVERGIRDFRNIVRLAAKLPETSILLTLLNQTGRMEIASGLAHELLAGIKAGRYDPVKRPDVLFAAMVDGLDRLLGRAERETLFKTLRLSPGGRQGDFAYLYADRMIATAALLPTLDGAPVPGRPAALTAGFDWEQAVRTAKQLAENQPVTGNGWPLAADLLAAAGRYSDAVELLAASGSKEAPFPTHTLMLRLDSACYGWLEPTLPVYPGIYRFVPR